MPARDPMHPDASRPVAARDRALALARQAPRCYARTRRGTLCQAPACVGRRRCRMHGGHSLQGAAHPRYQHGHATNAVRAERGGIVALLRACKGTLAELRR